MLQHSINLDLVCTSVKCYVFMVCVNVCVGEVKGQDVRYISFMGTFYVGARSPVVGLTNFSWRFMLVHCICYLTRALRHWPDIPKQSLRLCLAEGRPIEDVFNRLLLQSALYPVVAVFFQTFFERMGFGRRGGVKGHHTLEYQGSKVP